MGVFTLHTLLGTQDGVGAPWQTPGDVGSVQGERDEGLPCSWKAGRGAGGAAAVGGKEMPLSFLSL